MLVVLFGDARLRSRRAGVRGLSAWELHMVCVCVNERCKDLRHDCFPICMSRRSKINYSENILNHLFFIFFFSVQFLTLGDFVVCGFPDPTGIDSWVSRFKSHAHNDKRGESSTMWKLMLSVDIRNSRLGLICVFL